MTRKKMGVLQGPKKEELHGITTIWSGHEVINTSASEPPMVSRPHPLKKKKKKKKNPKEYAPVRPRTDCTWRGRRFEGGDKTRATWAGLRALSDGEGMGSCCERGIPN